MDSDEKIQAHILSVWREAKKLFSIHGKEGMLFLTDRHLIFILKTEAKMKWWQAATQRQVLSLLKSNNLMMRQDGYNEEQLQNDLENEKNMEISFDDILRINYAKKSWGGVLILEYNKAGKKEKFDFSVVKDWVKYPEKTPMKYIDVDWSPFVQFIKDRQKFTK
jgi:hypothetical protein